VEKEIKKEKKVEGMRKTTSEGSLNWRLASLRQDWEEVVRR
jgi:hypothetical protein